MAQTGVADDGASEAFTVVKILHKSYASCSTCVARVSTLSARTQTQAIADLARTYLAGLPKGVPSLRRFTTHGRRSTSQKQMAWTPPPSGMAGQGSTEGPPGPNGIDVPKWSFDTTT